MRRITSPQDLAALSEEMRHRRQQYTASITVCCGSGCQAGGCLPVWTALREELEQQGLSDKVYLRTTACHGFCEQGPLLVIESGNVFYCHLKPEDVAEIVSETLVNNRVVERLLYTDPTLGEKVIYEADIPFYRAQNRVLLGQNKLVDPRRIEDYIAIGGYTALAKVLTSMTSEEVIAEIRAAGLRGRGGGGFPTAGKWEACRRAPGSPKFVICNADEGDPGAYMNRSVLEGNPHSVLEGMIIGAYAIGAQHGFIYVRTEYPLAVEHSRMAIKQAREYELLGENILGSGFSFDVRVARGAGAFVSGESTALMAALEGKVSEPRPKDVHTVEHGYKNLPSNLNNVETWSDVPLIINNGSAWFAAKGTPKSTGTKIFALTGQIKNTGLVEVELGTPLRTILYNIGGGAVDGKEIKAVQIGGPSGGCIPAELFDLPVDFEALTGAGAMMGSGGMVVMDESACMVDVARYFLEFLKDESCGKCVPCHLGIDRMLEIITDITMGRGIEAQLALLEELGETVTLGSLCGLGKSAANPVLSTLRYFRPEYEAHVRERRCPAGVCRALIHYTISPENCTGCGVCLRACPHGAITGKKKELHVINDEICTRCGICKEECKFHSVIVT
jgi:NADH:ubiquinone oxidoreductase subunit F (NADH-binding)/(2Fe-2S) ferredoxin/Pyruvate/2-oxoacid:ferredoxin oxidoreductase delta subunit